MRLYIILLFSVLMAGCCIKFSEQTAGTEFLVGDVVHSCDTDILVEKFQAGNNNWISDGKARVDNQNYAKGSGNDINARNVNLNFQYDYPIDKITFKFGDYGGNTNIKINGDFRNLYDLMSINGSNVGGVPVVINAVQSGANWLGEIRLEGMINEFVIGGQELWLDDICPCN